MIGGAVHIPGRRHGQEDGTLLMMGRRYRMIRSLLLACLCAHPLASFAVWEERGGNPGGSTALAAASIAEEMQLDGALNEPAWRNAAVVELIQQSPRPGEATPYRTSVRVVVAKDSLYFGFECEDPEPSRIAIHTMDRDGILEGDDSVAIVLDTYGDRRSGYFFRSNAAGARIDGLVSDPEHPSTDWDGIWDVRTARSDRGWSAEFVIPSRTLAFRRGLPGWGLNLERAVARDRLVLRWQSPTLDSFFYDLSRSGSLTGIESLEQGLGLDVSPYVAGRIKRDFESGSTAFPGAVGGDVTYRITPQLASVVTINTDFAETEVDSRQLNVTRFPLFFPERRIFFLEGSNQFTFGLNMGEQFIPFFSRRVGLYDEQVVPINAGLKLTGRAGRFDIGMLDVQTRDSSVAPGTNLFAGRVSYDINDRFRVGTIFTNGDPDGLSENRLAGFDAVWRTSRFMGNKNFLVGGWAAASGGDIPEGNRTGWGLKVDYPNDLWDCMASVNDFGEALEPALGFLPRPGTRRYDLSCEYKPRPSKNGPFGWIRQNSMEHRYSRVTNYQGINESWRFWWAPLNLEFESGDRFEFNWVPTYEYLPEPFEISEGVVLPVGSYRFDRFRLEFETSSHRPWVFETTSWFGTFYNGNLLEQENSLHYTSPAGRWKLGVGLQQNFGELDQGNFVQRLWQGQFAFALNPDVVFTSFVQYDTESQNVGNNMRLRWTFRPGSDLFIVWNRGWRRLILSPSDLSLIPENELFAVKLRWTFRQ